MNSKSKPWYRVLYIQVLIAVFISRWEHGIDPASLKEALGQSKSIMDIAPATE